MNIIQRIKDYFNKNKEFSIERYDDMWSVKYKNQYLTQIDCYSFGYNRIELSDSPIMLFPTKGIAKEAIKIFLKQEPII